MSRKQQHERLSAMAGLDEAGAIAPQKGVQIDRAPLPFWGASTPGDSTMMHTPRAFRPRRALIIAVAPLLVDDAYLTMSSAEFVGAVMKASGGALNPVAVAQLYADLMDEAA